MKLALLLCLMTLPLSADYLKEYETPITKYLKPIEAALESNFAPIDCIYVINLDERPERFERVNKIFDQYNLKVNRVSAINGWKISDEVKKELVGNYPVLMRGGTYGCLLSHLSIIKSAYDKGYNLVWIMEDDIDIVDSLDKIPLLLNKLTELDPDWDIFYTDSFASRHPDQKVKICKRPDQKIEKFKYFWKKVTPDLLHVKARRETHSWIFSRKGLQKVLYHFTHAYLYRSIDIDVHIISGIRQYSPEKDIVTKFRGADSDTMPSSSLNPANK